MCDHLSVPIAWEKLEGPTSALTFSGIEIDLVAMQLCLPYSKLLELRELIKEWTTKPHCKRKELEPLAGKL